MDVFGARKVVASDLFLPHKVWLLNEAQWLDHVASADQAASANESAVQDAHVNWLRTHLSAIEEMATALRSVSNVTRELDPMLKGLIEPFETVQVEAMLNRDHYGLALSRLGHLVTLPSFKEKVASVMNSEYTNFEKAWNLYTKADTLRANWEKLRSNKYLFLYGPLCLVSARLT